MDRWTQYFADMSDDDLKSAWWAWGRDSETEGNLDRWAAVNYEMQCRGL